MNDHNLDDLIIDTPSQQGGKAKSILTIIALLIVIMIAAIVLTKIILKDPSAQPAILEENDVEIVSPELTLQSATKETAKKEDKTALSEMIEEEVEAPKAPEKTPKTDISKPEQPAVAEKKPAAKPHTPKVTAPKPKETVKIPQTATPQTPKKTVTASKVKHTPKPAATLKPATKPKPPVAKGSFYIQVGSFSKAPTPNSRLITAIRKQGFRHRIFTINGMKKVMVGPYGDRAAADRAIIRVKDLINKSAFVVKR
jgi:cell division protein FtsN